MMSRLETAGSLTNAGRMYLDMGHLEYASPECNSLTDVVTSDRAGDLLLQQAIDELGWTDDAVADQEQYRP